MSPLIKNPMMDEQCVVVGVHAFILRVSSYFGMAPLHFKPHRHGYIVSLSIPMCIYSYLLMSALVVVAFYGLISELKLGISPLAHMTSHLSQAMAFCDTLMVSILGCAGVYGAPFRMKTMIKFMNVIASVDKMVGKQYSHTRERRLRIGVVILFCLSTLVINNDLWYTVSQASVVNRQWSIVVNYFGFYSIWHLIMILEIQFTFTAMLVHERFRAVNEALRFIAEHVSIKGVQQKNIPNTLKLYTIRVAPAASRADKPHGIFISRSGTGDPRLLVSPTEAVQLIASLRGTLCEVVRHVENSYSISLVIILVTTLLHLIITPYFAITDFSFRTKGGSFYHYYFMEIMWFILHLLRLFMVVEPCHYTAEEGMKTEQLVCRMMTECTTAGPLASRLDLFCRQLMLYPVTYKPMGTCTLDRPLVVSVFGAVTTYLVILLQFQSYAN